MSNKVKLKDRLKINQFQSDKKVTAFGSSIQLNFLDKDITKSCNHYHHDFNEISTNLQMYEI